MAKFPLILPYTFGTVIVEADVGLAVTASTDASGRAANLNLNTDLQISSSQDGSASRETFVTAQAESTFGLSAAASNLSNAVSDSNFLLSATAAGATNHSASADLSVTLSTDSDSQESGIASSSISAIATPTASMSRGQEIDSELIASAITDCESENGIVISASFNAAATSTGYYGDPTAIVPQKFSSLVDKFNSKDTAKWSGWTGGADVVDGLLVMPVSGGGSIYTSPGDINTGNGVFDLTESYVLIHLIQPPNTDDSTPYARLEVRPQYSTTDASNQSAIRLDYIAGSWRLRQADASGTFGSPVTATHSASGGWVRIRLNNGMLYWDTSKDGIGWALTHGESLTGNGYHASSISITVDPGSSLNSGTAIWDQFNDLPQSIQAVPLSIIGSTDSVISRDQQVESLTAVEVSEFTDSRYDASSQSDLALTVLLLSEMIRDVYSNSVFIIEAESQADGTESGVGDSDTQLIASASGGMVSNQVITALSDIVAQSYAGVLRTIHASSDLDIPANGYASIKATYPAGAALPVYAFPTSVAIRNARVAGALAASISTESDSTEFGVADTALQISGIGYGGLSRGQSIEAMTGVFATIAVTAVLQHQIAASLAFNAWHTATADEPFAIVVVKVDNRTAKVSLSSRRASVGVENRRVIIPSATRST